MPPAYLQLGPLNAADASWGIAPGQFGAEDELSLAQFVGASVVHLSFDLSQTVTVGGRVQALDGCVVLLHELVCLLEQLLLAAVIAGQVAAAL